MRPQWPKKSELSTWSALKSSSSSSRGQKERLVRPLTVADATGSGSESGASDVAHSVAEVLTTEQKANSIGTLFTKINVKATLALFHF